MPMANTGATNATVAVSTTQNGCAAPAVTSYANWITNVGVVFAGNSGTLTYTARANTSGAVRSGNIQVGNTVFVVTESGAACSYSLNAYSASYGLLGGSGNILASGSNGGCGAPAAGASQPYISLGSLTSASNIFTQAFTVGQFNSAVKAVRKGTVTLGGQIFTVKQNSF